MIPLISILVGIAGGFLGAWIGMRVSQAQLEVRMAHVESEIGKLRDAKHDHAQFLTRHEMDLEILKRKA